MKDLNSVTVVLAADNQYARPLTTAAYSVISTLDPSLRLQLCVLDMGIDPKNRQAMEKTFNRPNVDILWVGSVKDRVTHLPNTWTAITRAGYARLYIPEVLPETVTRALYLDCDVIARRCVSELFFSDMNGFATLAVPDVQAPFVSSPYAVPYWFEAGRSAGELNFNTGVLLMDLEAWRKENVTEDALRYLTDGRHHFAQDQEAINAVLGQRIGELDPRWNQQSELFLKQYEVILPYERSVVDRLKVDPWIIHFANQVKPWHYGFSHPFLQEWFMNLDQTAFAGWRPTLTRLLARKARTLARRSVAAPKNILSRRSSDT